MAALLVGSLVALQFASAAEPGLGDKEITSGWYKVTVGGKKTVERCYLDSEMLLSAADDLDENCKTDKRVVEGEQFEILQSCQIDEETIKARLTGIVRPGYLKVRTEFVQIPEELRAFFGKEVTMEAQRVRDCTADELSKVRK
jgi:hypothetical protein